MLLLFRAAVVAPPTPETPHANLAGRWRRRKQDRNDYGFIHERG